MITKHAQYHIISGLLIIQYQLIKSVDISFLAARDEQYLIVSHWLPHNAASFLLYFRFASVAYFSLFEYQCLDRQNTSQKYKNKSFWYLCSLVQESVMTETVLDKRFA